MLGRDNQGLVFIMTPKRTFDFTTVYFSPLTRVLVACASALSYVVRALLLRHEGRSARVD